jgi:ribonuclease D
MKTNVHLFDIPKSLLDRVKEIKELSIDTEAMGLEISRDRLCTIQMFIDRSEIHIVHFPEINYEAKNLKKFLNQKNILKIFHFARFDIGIIYKYLDILMENVVCTRTLSKIARTYSDRHSLKELCREILKKELNKGEQSSDWGKKTLTQSQISYAANDVIFLPEIFEHLKEMCIRENRYEVAEAIFKIFPELVFISHNNFDILRLIDH